MKFNINQIIIDHFKTLYNARYKEFKLDYVDVSIMYGVPLLIIIGIYFSDFDQHDDVLDTIVISLSIFVGLLLNLFVLVYNISEKGIEGTNFKERKLDRIRKDVLIELCQNISYAILISIFSIIIFICTIFLKGYFEEIGIYLIYYLFLNFTFTLLMIIRRTHYLLVNNENHSRNRKQ